MWLYAICSLIVECIGWYRKSEHGFSDLNIFVVFQIIEYFLVTRFFVEVIGRYRRLIEGSCLVVVGFNIVALLDPSSNSPLKTNSFLVGGILLCMWSLFYFFQLFRDVGEAPLEQNPTFWVSVGVIFFYAGCFFIYGYANAISKYDRKLASDMYEVINHLLNCLYYGMISYGFLCQTKYHNL